MVVVAFGAHPDDIDFGYAATLAKWAKEGAEIIGVVSTSGSRGSREHQINQAELIKERKQEQLDAAKIVGIKEIIFLDREDGNLTADLDFKEEIVKIIRKYKPLRVLTHDPSFYYQFREDYAMINHNDHRETGIAVLDGVYPLARDLSSFPEHVKEGLTPHKVLEVYMPNFNNPNYLEDVTDTIEIKISAINAHKSQIDDPSKTHEWVKERASQIGQKSGFKYAEGFVRLKLR